MKATLTYEGKTVEVEIDENEVRKIFAKPKKTGWERVGKGEQYYRLSFLSDVDNIGENCYYTKGKYFSDKQLAEDQSRAVSLWMRIKRWAAEHCAPERAFAISWNNGVIVIHNTFNGRDAFGVFFDTTKHAAQCIEEFRDDLTWYFTECRDRMDGEDKK